MRGHQLRPWTPTEEEGKVKGHDVTPSSLLADPGGTQTP